MKLRHDTLYLHPIRYHTVRSTRQLFPIFPIFPPILRDFHGRLLRKKKKIKAIADGGAGALSSDPKLDWSTERSCQRGLERGVEGEGLSAERQCQEGP